MFYFPQDALHFSFGIFFQFIGLENMKILIITDVRQNLITDTLISINMMSTVQSSMRKDKTWNENTNDPESTHKIFFHRKKLFGL